MDERQLGEALERHGEQLSRISGVVGTGIGAASDQPDTRCIHVYVLPGSDVDAVREQVTRLLGGAPVDLQVMDMPEAYGD